MSESNRSSRRQFLSSAARTAGAAAFLAGASGSLGAASIRPRLRPMLGRLPRADEPIRMGVIGTGGMGTGHCNSIIALAADGKADVKIVALADVCEPRLMAAHKDCAEKQKIDVDTYTDYRELLARDDIHGVLIASPEHWHTQHAVDALTAGKDVYLEKPMTLRLDQALALRQAVLSHPERIFQVGTQMIMQPKYAAAREAIAEGAIGTPVWTQTSYCRNSPDGEWNYYAIDPKWKPGENLDWDAWLGYLGPRPWDPKVYARWRRYKDFSTGIIGDLLVHVMTPLIYTLQVGWPRRVVGTGSHLIDKAMENHDQVNLAVKFDNGHQMIVAGSTCNEAGLTTMIRGNEANLYLGGRHVEIKPERPYADVVDQREITCPDIGNDQDLLRLNWFECMRSREPAASTIDLGVKVMVIVDLATRSMWEGRAFEFDAESMTAKAV